MALYLDGFSFTTVAVVCSIVVTAVADGVLLMSDSACAAKAVTLLAGVWSVEIFRNCAKAGNIVAIIRGTMPNVRCIKA